jgi:hypothetical protein
MRKNDDGECDFVASSTWGRGCDNTKGEWIGWKGEGRARPRGMGGCAPSRAHPFFGVVNLAELVSLCQ